MSMLSVAVDKIKVWASANAKKLLLIALAISVCLNLILLISTIQFSIQQNQTTTQHNNQTTKVDTWSINQNQNVNINILADYYKSGKLSVVTTNVTLPQLTALVTTMDAYSFMYKNVVSLGNNQFFVIYPSITNRQSLTKVSSTNIVSKTTNANNTNFTKTGTIWKLF